MNYLNSTEPMKLFEKECKGRLYVDKSMLIEKISDKVGSAGQYICITRPRRFGKTINANMLAAYFTKGCDSTELFNGLKIHDSPVYGEKQNQYNVIHIDFSVQPDFCECYRDYISNIIENLKEDLAEAYPAVAGRDYAQISRMFRDTGDTFIFILDEWDSVFYEKFMEEDDRIQFLKWLKGLLKDKPYVELAYMTGILPIAKYSSGSELNMFDEYNFMNDNVYDQYFGFSEEEVHRLCEKYGTVSFAELKEWYDGYYFYNGDSLFNPRSVNRALDRGLCLNYWTETGPMNEIADCIENNVDEVRGDIVEMVAGIPVETELGGYSAAELQLNSRDEILSAMVVYGFLAYHDGKLSIPNYELMEKYQKVLTRDSMAGVKEIVSQSKEVLEATLRKDAARVAELLEQAHDREIPFLEYNDENALSCVITLCYLYARKDYRMEREAKAGKGYCDYIFIPRSVQRPAIILELKYGKSCEEAIEQIRERQYIRKVEHCKEILLVGINYDPRTKKHTCKIETA
ncbi:MAG: ATP-binding protein [Lachnospiraceae bacterium]|nr:ATP-binding protein [Lachnospiraceae bacterium]